MDELKKVTVEALRKLARKHLKKGYSKLRKQELWNLLRQVPEALSGLLKKAAPARKPLASKPLKRKPAKAAAKATRKRVSGAPASPKRSSPAPRSASSASSPLPERSAPASRRLTSAPSASPQRSQPAPKPSAEPPLEGFFVARVAGAREAANHHMTERDVAPPIAARSVSWGEEREEDLPGGDLGEELVALARDPHTLFVFWSYPPARLQKTQSGLRAPRSVFRVYQGAALVKEVSFEVTSKSHYLTPLHGGKTYRVEPMWIDADGKTAPIGKPSNEVSLPPSAPAPEEPSRLRFVDVPVQQPVKAFRQKLEQQAVPIYSYEQVEEPPSYLDWQAGVLPGSAERAGRERQPAAAPSLERARPHYVHPSGAEAGPLGASEHSR